MGPKRALKEMGPKMALKRIGTKRTPLKDRAQKDHILKGEDVHSTGLNHNVVYTERLLCNVNYLLCVMCIAFQTGLLRFAGLASLAIE